MKKFFQRNSQKKEKRQKNMGKKKVRIKMN